MADKPSKVALQVFAVPELLENILTFVEDPIKLFVLQRVCKTFQALIASSIALRRRMCLEPDPSRLRVKPLLQDKRIVRLMSPFTFRLLVNEQPVAIVDEWIKKAEVGDGVEALDMEVSCKTMHQWGHPKDPFTSFHETMRLVHKNGSWQRIKLGTDGVHVHGILSCESTYWGPARQQLKPNATLDEMLTMALATLSTKWGMRLGKCVHDSHACQRDSCCSNDSDLDCCCGHCDW